MQCEEGNEQMWDYFRTFEVVARMGSFKVAARHLGVSQSTVSRHIQHLEETCGEPLMHRTIPLTLTSRGEALKATVEPLARAAQVAESELLDHDNMLSGTVTLATVGEVARWTIVPQLSSLYERAPDVTLCVLTDNSIISLAAGEADISLRLTRPTRGDLVARKVRDISYGLYASEQLAVDDETAWLGLTGSLSSLAEQQWRDRVAGKRPTRFLVEDVEALGLAVQAGQGIAVLPRSLAARLEGMVELDLQQFGVKEALPEREVWLVVHGTKQHVPRVRAVIAWLVEEVFDGDKVGL